MSRSRGRGGPPPRGKRAQADGGFPASLPRAQVDILLERIAAEARQCIQANPDDPAVFQRVVVRTRELLRITALEHHLHIGDTAQHLIRELDEGRQHAHEPEIPSIAVDRADLMHSARMSGEPVADVGLELADDPFDVDSYAPREASPEQPAEPASAPNERGPALPAFGKERRQETDPRLVELHRGLTAAQLETLGTMSQFGWTLRFVRRPMFQQPIPVVFDRNRRRFVVVEADGSVDEDPGLQIRD